LLDGPLKPGRHGPVSGLRLKLQRQRPFSAQASGTFGGSGLMFRQASRHIGGYAGVKRASGGSDQIQVPICHGSTGLAKGGLERRC